MDRVTWLYLFLLYVWCSLNTSPISGVNGESIQVYQKTPIGDIIAGDTVQLECNATGFPAGFFIEWSRDVMGAEVLIARNVISLNSNYSVTLHSSSHTDRIEILTMYNIDRHDTGTYYCRAKMSDPHDGTVQTLLTTIIQILVLYFPSDMYPVCFPDGPITVQEGTTLNMSCTSEIGYPYITMHIMTTGVVYLWMYIITDDEAKSSLELTVGAADVGNLIKCKITSVAFPGMERSCFIGPINVVHLTTQSIMTTDQTAADIQPTNEHVTTEDSHPPTNGQITTMHSVMETDDVSITPDIDLSCYHLYCSQGGAEPTSFPWIAISSTCLVLLLVSVIIIIFLIYYVIKLRRLHRIPEEKATNVLTADPYMELQPTDDRNIQYMDPATTGSTSAHHTYCQALEVQDESPEYDYVKPEDKNLTYEVTSVPQNKDTKYQNIMS